MEIFHRLNLMIDDEFNEFGFSNRKRTNRLLLLTFEFRRRNFLNTFSLVLTTTKSKSNLKAKETRKILLLIDRQKNSIE